MTIVALAVETSHNLHNSIVVADSPEDAAAQLHLNLALEEGEVIFLLCADVLLPDGSNEDPQEYSNAVLDLFEQTAPELFADGYFEDAE